MLSEHHNIVQEFPEHYRLIEKLKASNRDFAEIVARHDFVDDEIRILEENQSPTSDTELEKLKFERTNLKDKIFTHLRNAATQ